MQHIESFWKAMQNENALAAYQHAVLGSPYVGRSNKKTSLQTCFRLRNQQTGVVFNAIG